MFELDPAASARLYREAERHADDATSLYEFTRLINDHFELTEKENLVELLWFVAFADGALDKYEEHLVRRVADLVHVSHGAFIRAKHRAMQRSRQPPLIGGSPGRVARPRDRPPRFRAARSFRSGDRIGPAAGSPSPRAARLPGVEGRNRNAASDFLMAAEQRRYWKLPWRSTIHFSSHGRIRLEGHVRLCNGNSPGAPPEEEASSGRAQEALRAPA